jgi:hypothetical protein
VPAIRDESVAVLPAATAGAGSRCQRRPRWHDASLRRTAHLDRQREAAEHGDPFRSSAMTIMRAGGSTIFSRNAHRRP